MKSLQKILKDLEIDSKNNDCPNYHGNPKKKRVYGFPQLKGTKTTITYKVKEDIIDAYGDFDYIETLVYTENQVKNFLKDFIKHALAYTEKGIKWYKDIYIKPNKIIFKGYWDKNDNGQYYFYLDKITVKGKKYKIGEEDKATKYKFILLQTFINNRKQYFYSYDLQLATVSHIAVFSATLSLTNIDNFLEEIKKLTCEESVWEIPKCSGGFDRGIYKKGE